MRPQPAALASLVLTVTFAAGLSAGRLSAPRPTPPPDLTAEAGVMRLDDPGPTNRRLYPFRVVVDGTAANVDGARPSGPRWRLDLADGRITVFASEGGGGGR
jgi:hypothetical protein